MGTLCALFTEGVSAVTLEELKEIEDAARIASEESDHERPFLERYLDAKAARESAEEADTNGTQLPL